METYSSIKNAPYPRLVIDLKKLRHNVDVAVANCSRAGIKVCGVVKAFNGLCEPVKEFADGGCAQIGTSRVRQMKEHRMQGIEAEFLLVRVPMISEAEDVVNYADISLNSDMDVLKALNDAAAKSGKRHGVIIMADLGDLREGFWNKDELADCAVMVEKELEHLVLRGVGTNLGCYGSIRPTVEKMNELIEIAEMVERRIGRKLEIISGGATSSYVLVLDGMMPERINHLRLGEGVINNYDLPKIWGLDIEDMHDDACTLELEVIEVKDKPTHPVGEICVDSFGRKPEYVDRGIRRRALLAAGKLDFALNDRIFPVAEGAEIIGSSSDHLILDVEDCIEKIKTGDIMEFKISYPSLVYLSNSKYINVTYI